MAQLRVSNPLSGMHRTGSVCVCVCVGGVGGDTSPLHASAHYTRVVVVGRLRCRPADPRALASALAVLTHCVTPRPLSLIPSPRGSPQIMEKFRVAGEEAEPGLMLAYFSAVPHATHRQLNPAVIVVSSLDDRPRSRRWCQEAALLRRSMPLSDCWRPQLFPVRFETRIRAFEEGWGGCAVLRDLCVHRSRPLPH